MYVRSPIVSSRLRGHRAPVPPRSVRMLTASLTQAACNGPPRNRRTEIRRVTRLGCIARRMDTWHLVGDRTIDLSPSGMLLLSDEYVDSGLELVVSFQATELPIWFDTLATVSRVVEGRRPGDAGRALGVHFDTLPAVSRLILRGHLRKHPETLSRRDLPVELLDPDPDYAQWIRDIWAGR